MDYSKFQTTTDRSDMFYWQGDRPFDPIETKEIFLDRHETYDENVAKAAVSYGMQQAGKSETDAEVVHIDPSIVVGSVNIVCRAVLKDETAVIIRMHPQKIHNGYFWSESVASQIAKDNGVPTYTTYFVDDSQSKFDFDYMIMECVPGKNIRKDMWPLSKELDKKIAQETGYWAAKINSIATSGYGFFDNAKAKKEKKLAGVHTKWEEHLFAANEKNIGYLEDKQVITNEERKTIDAIFDTKKSYINCENPKLIQNDIADWNELASDDGTITGVLDWDECFSGDPIMEIAGWSLFFGGERLENFFIGYRKVIEAEGGFEEKYHIYRLRYVLSKLAMRKKKTEFTYYDTQFQRSLVNVGLEALREELTWQSTHH